MSKPLNILIVEDSEDDALLLLVHLRKNGYHPDFLRVETREAMLAALAQRTWDIVVSDYVMPRFSGLLALTALKESRIDLPFIIVSGNIGEDIAVEAMRAGANDYILKGNLARLAPAIERELREAELRKEKIRTEEERVRLVAAVESAADAVVITDASGVIQYVNPSFKNISGRTRKEVEGQKLHLLESGNPGEHFPRRMRDVMERDGARTGRLTCMKKDGSFYEEECTYSLIKASSGEPLNYVFLKRDITDKLRLESIAQAVDTMNNIGYIFTGVRHEIGNPVNAVIMGLSLLKAKIDTFDKATIAKYIDGALNNCEKVEYLLRSLRSFNMFERPEFQEVIMKDFLGTFHALVKEDFEKKGIAIDISHDAEKVYADPRLLQQVLLNLFTNAADALQGRKDPRISAHVSSAGSLVRLQVRDNGSGIPEDRLKELFKPFQTSKSHGNGLGLVIVKRMLTMMNSTITITSRHGEGTTVEIFVPKENDRGSSVSPLKE